MHILTLIILNIIFAIWFFVRMAFSLIIAIPMAIVFVVVAAFHLMSNKR